VVDRGFSFRLFFKKSPPRTKRPARAVLHSSSVVVARSQRVNRERLVWRPRRPKPFKAVASPMLKVGLGVGLALVVYWVLGSQAFVLTELVVTGHHLVATDEITEALFPGGFRPVNAILFSDSRAESRVLAVIPQIREVSFAKRVFDKQLVVDVAEHETTIIWQSNNERFMVNRSGVVYDVAPQDSPLTVVEDLKNVPVNLNQKIVTTDFIEFVTAVVANLPRKTNLAARRVMVPETTFEIEVVTSEGWTIILDTTRSIETQLTNLVKVLRTHGVEPRAYVDLRIEDRVYYK